MEKLQIIPLGGLGEVGKNMLILEYGRNILVLDVGLMFPETTMPGVDFIIPDYDYLRDKADRIRGVVITHGHEDHIGALPYFLREFNVPVYATLLTRGLIEVKLDRMYFDADGVSPETGAFCHEEYRRRDPFARRAGEGGSRGDPPRNRGTDRRRG